jgi:hypothetical protein
MVSELEILAIGCLLKRPQEATLKELSSPQILEQLIIPAFLTFQQIKKNLVFNPSQSLFHDH